MEIPTDLPRTGEEREVLVVDDSAMMRDLVANILGNAGYNVCKAGSAKEGLTLFTERPISFVIADLNLVHGINGAEFLKNLAILQPGIRGILMSGALPPDQTGQRRFPVLLKPFKPQDLLALISDL